MAVMIPWPMRSTPSSSTWRISSMKGPGSGALTPSSPAWSVTPRPASRARATSGARSG